MARRLGSMTAMAVTPIAHAAITLAAITLAACSSSPTASSPTEPPSSAAASTTTAAAITTLAPTSTVISTTSTEATPDTAAIATKAVPTTTSLAPEDVPPRPSAGCGDSSFTLGEVTSPITFAGEPGRVLEMLPTAYDGTTPLPLVLDLHGYSSPLEIQRQFSNLATTGEAHGFVVEIPQVDREVPRWDATVESTDAELLEQLLDSVVSSRCIDEARVYVAGMSNGAFMTSALACRLSDRIAAAAPVAGVRDPEGCSFGRAVPVIAFHGTADTYVAYDGGLGASVADLPTEGGGTVGTAVVIDDGPSVEEITAAWALRNGCDASPPSEQRATDDVVLLEWDCPVGAETELFRVEDGGHAWPGSAFSQAVEGTVGRTTMSIDANELMWAFFEQHPLAG